MRDRGGGRGGGSSRPSSARRASICEGTIRLYPRRFGAVVRVRGVGRLRLTYAGEDHFDRMKALQTGQISPSGIDLNYVAVGVRELFRRQARFAEFESSEMSVSTMTMMISGGI